jgi:hypothetical protein
MKVILKDGSFFEHESAKRVEWQAGVVVLLKARKDETTLSRDEPGRRLPGPEFIQHDVIVAVYNLAEIRGVLVDGPTHV